MSMSKSNSKEKSLGPLFRKRGDGGLEIVEFEIPTGSYLYSGGWALSSQANTTSRCMHLLHTSVSCFINVLDLFIDNYMTRNKIIVHRSMACPCHPCDPRIGCALILLDELGPFQFAFFITPHIKCSI